MALNREDEDFDNETSKVIVICSGAGGVGKSCSTAFLSVAISKLTKNEVLCANLNTADHASMILGVLKEHQLNSIDAKLRENIVKIKVIGIPPITIYTNFQGVDILTYSSIKNITTEEELITGNENLKRLFHDVCTSKKYKYIVCDSGRGTDTRLERQSICLADIIIFPINNSRHALRGVESIYNYLKEVQANQFIGIPKEKQIYFFYNKGNTKEQQKYQHWFDEALENLIKSYKEHLGLDASIIKAVIPGTSRINNYIASGKDLFLDKKVKDIADVYLLAASEIELLIQKQSFQQQLSAKETARLNVKKYDAFISHASEDKDEFVRPLANLLIKNGFRICYDEFEFEVGDSLREAIDKGLINSRYGIVVLSKNFIDKTWTKYELNSLVAKELNGQKIILPIWHNISKDEILNYSPMLADRLALSSEFNSITEIAKKICNVLDKSC